MKRGFGVQKCFNIYLHPTYVGTEISASTNQPWNTTPTVFITSKFTMANSTSDELDLKRVSFSRSEESALGSRLENDLHQIYRRFNFRASALIADTSGEDDNEPFLEGQVYGRMVPAFRLASLLLDFSLLFYTKVFCADLIFVGQQYAFDPTYECTGSDIQCVRNLLVEISDRTRFYCRTPSVGLTSPDDAIALAVSEVRTGGRPLPTPAHSLIRISERTIQFFSQEGYDEIDAETKTSQLVQLAFVLVHEQAHAIFNHKWAKDSELSENERDSVRRVSPREPMYHVHMDPRYNELGFALQAWLHGGSILSRGRDLIFIEYPGDVLSEHTFRGTLLSADFWRAVRDSPRPSDYWNKTDLPQGCLGQPIERNAS